MKKELPTGNLSPSIRALDLALSILGIIFLFPIIIFFALLILIVDKQPPFFIQERIGRNKTKFKIIKLRTMKKGTPCLPAHKISSDYTTQLGRFLRKTKIDELPQLVNVLKGEMSFVGPRPSIEDEIIIIQERRKRRLYYYRPGITGLAPVNKVDMSNPKLVARLDLLTIKNLNICTFLMLIIRTAIGEGSHDPASKSSSKQENTNFLKSFK